MQKHKTIKALFFLGIFSMLLLHHVVPHWHHQHQDEHHHDITLTHHNHHHHHEKSQKENPKKGFLDWFLEMHTHTNATTDVLMLRQTTVKKITVEKETLAKTVSTNTYILLVFEADTATKKWYQPPDELHSNYHPNTSLRGPPSLG
jgi:zinc transporter ZupT